MSLLKKGRSSRTILIAVPKEKVEEALHEVAEGIQKALEERKDDESKGERVDRKKLL